MGFIEYAPTFEVDGKDGEINDSCSLLTINVKDSKTIDFNESELNDMLKFIRKMKKQKDKRDALSELDAEGSK